MSDNILRLIPVDPQYIPDGTSQRTMQDQLASFRLQADNTRIKITSEVKFVDAGENFERVLCPTCGADLGEWWRTAMDTAYKTKFADLSVHLPCCGTKSSLNDLRYEWPAGFSRFVIEVHNPDHDLNDEQIHSLEQILGCKLRKIWTRY